MQTISFDFDSRQPNCLKYLTLVQMFTGFHLQVLKTQYLFVSSGIKCCCNFSPQIRLEISVHGLCRYVVVLYLTLASLQREKIPCVKIFYPDKDFSLGHLHGRLLVQTTDGGNNSFLDLKIETEEGEMAQ